MTSVWMRTTNVMDMRTAMMAVTRKTAVTVVGTCVCATLGTFLSFGIGQLSGVQFSISLCIVFWDGHFVDTVYACMYSPHNVRYPS